MFVIALLVIPVAAQAGSQVYQASMRTVNEQAASRHSVEAVAVDGSMSMPVDFDGPPPVRVQWHEGTRLRTAEVTSPAIVEAGDQLTIWLDDAGKVVGQPLRPADAKMSALIAAWLVWLTAIACSVLCVFVIRRRLDRHRARAWERELLLLAYNDDGWANRHP